MTALKTSQSNVQIRPRAAVIPPLILVEELEDTAMTQIESYCF